MKIDGLALSPVTFKMMEIMLILTRMWIFQYLWYWPKVKPIKMQISAKWKVSENRESLTDRGVPSNPSSLSAQRKMLANMCWRDAFKFLALGLNIVLCAEPFVMQWKTACTDGMCLLFFYITLLEINWKFYEKVFASLC